MVDETSARAAAQTKINEAVVAYQSGNLTDAAKLLARATVADPTWPEPRERLATVLVHDNNAREALGVLLTCLQLRPVPVTSLNLLSQLLQQFPVRSAEGISDDDLIAALEVEEASAQPLARLVFRLVQSRGALSEVIDRGRRDGWPLAAESLLSAASQDDAGLHLFYLALRRGINTEPQVELLLTQVRRHLLLDLDRNRLSSPALGPLLAALFVQCINNEYVYFADAEERAAVDLLDSHNGEPSAVILHALYEPPKPIPTAGSIIATSADHEILELAASYLRDREEERALAEQFPSRGSFRNDVSHQVANQYEENPYPRWLDVTTTDAGAIRDRVNDLLAEEEPPLPSGDAKVLIAGCGTGRQVVTAARGLMPYSTLTAIDLSRASLGYAARKAQLYGLAQVEFIHMDLLALAELGRNFDFVLCTGVLHHMADPLAGIKTLVRHLNPGGIVNFALYSSLARAHIELMTLDDNAHETPEAAIRAYRYQRLAVDTIAAKFPNGMPEDFSTLSGCRDLIFHAHECRFTIPELAEMLAETKLKFLGFNLRPATLAEFQSQYPGFGAQRDLGLWWEFEQLHPTTFSEMYNFWVQKPL